MYKRRSNLLTTEDSDNLEDDPLRLPLTKAQLKQERIGNKLLAIDTTAKILSTLQEVENTHLINSIRASDLPPIDKLYQWAASKPFFKQVKRELKLLNNRQEMLFFVLALFIMGTGAFGSWQLLQPNELGHINIFWWLGLFLGIPILSLFIWLLSFLWPSERMSFLGSWLLDASMSLNAWISRLANRSTTATHASASLIGFLQYRGISAWYSALLTHAFWLLYLLGGTLALILTVSFEHLIFVWQTSWLSAETYQTVISKIAYLPSLIGFSAPSEELINFSQWQGSGGTANASKEWASFMIGCALIYGLAPRFILWLLCQFCLNLRIKQVQLDHANPFYGKYVKLLTPKAHTSSGKTVLSDSNNPVTIIRAPLGNADMPIQWIRYETMATNPFSLRKAHPNSVLLVDVDDIDSHDMAIRSSRVLTAEDTYCICVGVNITQAPDKSFQQFLKRLVNSTSIRVIVVLTGMETLKARGEEKDLTQRINQWTEYATLAHIHHKDCITLEINNAQIKETFANYFHYATATDR